MCLKFNFVGKVSVITSDTDIVKLLKLNINPEDTLEWILNTETEKLDIYLNIAIKK